MNEDKIRRLLGRNAALTRSAQDHGAAIRSAAGEALDGLEKRLGEAKPGSVLLNGAQAHAYRRDVADRARLSLLLGSTSA